MENKNITRGYGLLENFLSKKRAVMADKLIPNRLRKGRILDIGCGVNPFFLKYIKFNYKYGLDKSINNTKINDKFILSNFDIEKDEIPFKNEFFDVVTMLAVIEHLETEKIVGIIKKIKRVLKPSGRLIITTPHPLADYPLRIMSILKLVSSDEIDEHKDHYNPSKITSILEKSGFNKNKIKYGYFEMFFNVWGHATK